MKIFNLDSRDLGVLSIIPAAIILPGISEGLAGLYLGGWIIWLFMSRRSGKEAPSVSAKKSDDFSKQDKMKVLAGVDFKGKHPKAHHTLEVIDED